MFKSVLPLYKTGWFYLLLLFWGMSSWTISNGGLNQANQLNINLLDYLAPTKKSSENKATLAATQILTLQSSFNESDIDAIKALLTHNPESKIILFGKPSKSFITRLEAYLSAKPRSNKALFRNFLISGSFS